jgi:hypothetical protein
MGHFWLVFLEANLTTQNHFMAKTSASHPSHPAGNGGSTGKELTNTNPTTHITSQGKTDTHPTTTHA